MSKETIGSYAHERVVIKISKQLAQLQQVVGEALSEMEETTKTWNRRRANQLAVVNADYAILYTFGQMLMPGNGIRSHVPTIRYIKSYLDLFEKEYLTKQKRRAKGGKK